MRIALIQHDIAWNNPAETVSRCSRLAQQASTESAQIMIFPEMFSCGFSFLCGDDARAAEKISVDFLSSTAEQHNCFTVGSMPALTKDSDRPLNMIRVFGPQGLLGEYSKIHLISFLDESQYYQSGNSLLTLPIGNVCFTFFICFDLRFPDIFSAAAKRTDCFVVAANWPDTRQAHWEKLLEARAIENQAYVAAVNRVGQGGKLNFIGGSRVIDPSGKVIAAAGAEEEIVYATVRSSDVLDYRREFNFLQDRREDLYTQL